MKPLSLYSLAYILKLPVSQQLAQGSAEEQCSGKLVRRKLSCELAWTAAASTEVHCDEMAQTCRCLARRILNVSTANLYVIRCRTGSKWS